MMAGDPFAAWLNLSRAAIDAQAETMKAARSSLGVADAGVAAQRAMTAAAEANMKAVHSWARLWGLR